MTNRKDMLKKLGITEYPWSSDDDEPPADPRPSPVAPPRNSGHQPFNSVPWSISTPTRNQIQNRELFYSLLTQTTPRSVPAPSTSSGNHSSRADEMPIAYMPRANHTPAAEIRERPSPYADSDIQRVCAFKQLTSNINNARYSRYSIPRRTRAWGTVVPQESTSINMSLGVPSTRRMVPRYLSPVINDTSDTPRQNGVERSSSNRVRRMNSMEYLRTFDDEDAVLMTQPLGPAAPGAAPNTPAPAIAADTPAQATESETVSSNDSSGANISLEEEIVEILDEPAANAYVDMDLIDRARAAVISSSCDPNLASTSQPDEVDAPALEQQNQGVKRKRRESTDDRPADQFTVKDFNQGLLRLLECPVCLEVMEPPMSQCRRGHLVCNRCRSRLASCPVCRTTFSSVRNRAMEGVAEMLRYPCRHGCGREVRLRRRAPHESSCADRKYLCPAPPCTDLPPLARSQLSNHFHSKHFELVKLGARHQFGIKMNSELHDNWLLIALDEFFHMKVDVNIRTWGVVVYVAYIGPKCNAKDFAYEVSIDGQHNSRKMQYMRATHSDLESSSLNVSRQDCFHLTLDQALNFIRFKNRHCDSEKYLEFTVEITKLDPPPSRDDSDS